MSKVSLKSQIAALERAIGSSGKPGIFREGHQELHRKHLEAGLESLRWLDRNEAWIKSEDNRGKFR
jgi:hypothetical protein